MVREVGSIHAALGSGPKLDILSIPTPINSTYRKIYIPESMPIPNIDVISTIFLSKITIPKQLTWEKILSIYLFFGSVNS